MHTIDFYGLCFVIAAAAVTRESFGGGVAITSDGSQRGPSKGGRGQGGKGQDSRGRSQSGRRPLDKSKGSKYVWEFITVMMWSLCMYVCMYVCV